MTDESKRPLSYRDAGVDIDAKSELLRSLRETIDATRTPEVISGVGGFGGLFNLGVRFRRPVLVASADGVGTKLRVAVMAGVHDTVGVDLVNHCVNDILVQGARPLFFLDYFATGALDASVARDVVAGVAEGCRANGCALLGGETAEMPDMYDAGDYDLAGFIVGIVERDRLVDGSGVQAADKLVGLASSGLHTNGYSLARKLFFERLGLRPDSHVEELGTTVSEALLAPHRSYLQPILPLVEDRLVQAMAHITGGGFTDNVPRVLREGFGARVHPDEWDVPPLFRFIQERAELPDAEMLRVFNMGIGMVLVVHPEDLEPVMTRLEAADESPVVIGEVGHGTGVSYE